MKSTLPKVKVNHSMKHVPATKDGGTLDKRLTAEYHTTTTTIKARGKGAATKGFNFQNTTYK